MRPTPRFTHPHQYGTRPHPWRVFPIPVAFLALIMGPVVVYAGAADAVDFGRDVLPILSDKCFRCHGPDAGTRKANLRLDTKEGALRTVEPVIVPGNCDESELIYRITSEDDLDRMPPPKSNLSLTPEQ